MIIYSEILGKEFDTVNECLMAEKEYEDRLERERLQKEAERKALEDEVNELYAHLVDAWKEFISVLDMLAEDLDNDTKALILAEVFLDAEEEHNDSEG